MAEIDTKPSQMITQFLDYLKDASNDYINAKNDVDVRTKANIDYLHDIEFASNKAERNRIATKMHNNQLERRKSKDKMQLNEKLNKFNADVGNRGFIKQLRLLAEEQKKTEDFLESPRHYNRMVGDSNADDTN